MTQGITAGIGYSVDTQQLAPEVCFNGKASPLSNKRTDFRVTTAMSYTNMEQELHEHIGVKVGIGMFSGGVETHYMKYIRDQEYSLSLLYFTRADGTVAIRLIGVGEKALTDVGSDTYKDNHEYFGITCGSHYVSSYKVGAVLIMGINVGFKSHYDKETFESKVSASWGDIFSASHQIKEIFTNYKLAGSVSIHAFQIGGDPAQMPKSLSKDAKGNYYILQCSVEKMNNCVSAASGMLEYANKHFTQQVSLEGDGKGLVELPGSYEYKPIRYIKLTAPKSLVTPEVCRARKELEIALDANRYYFSKLADLRFRYPVAWDERSAAYFALKPLYEQAEGNLRALMDRDPHRGAIGCYSFPDECLEIAKGVKGRMKEITADDLAPVSEVTRWCYEFKDTPPMLSMPSSMLICSNGKAYASSSEFHDNTIRYRKGLWTSYSINVTQSYCSIQFSKAATSSITFRYDFADDGITSDNGYRVEDALHNIKGRMVAGVIIKHNSSFHIPPYTSTIDIDLECGKPAGATSDSSGQDDL